MREPIQKPSQSYRDVSAWQKAMLLTESLYRLSTRFPPEEKFGLTSQRRRAAVSVPSNLAEGQVRRTVGEFVQFISHAEGSVVELDTQLALAVEPGFCCETDAAEAQGLIQELRKMLNAHRRSISRNS